MQSIYTTPDMHTSSVLQLECLIHCFIELSSETLRRREKIFNLHSNLWQFPLTRHIWAGGWGSLLLFSVFFCKAGVKTIWLKSLSLTAPSLPLPPLFPPPSSLAPSVFPDKTADKTAMNNNKAAALCSPWCHQRPKGSPPRDQPGSK